MGTPRWQRERERDTLEERLLNHVHRFNNRRGQGSIHPAEFTLSTLLETQKLLLACFSSEEEGETILSVTWVRTCEMHQLHNGAFSTQLLTRSLLCSEGHRLIPPRIYVTQEQQSPRRERESVSLCFFMLHLLWGNDMVTSQHSVYKWYMKCSWPRTQRSSSPDCYVIFVMVHSAHRAVEKPTPRLHPHIHTHHLFIF